ncbi:N-acetylneuraminate synthase family protein [Sedimentibacter sp. zth1]|uniref:N-acetylneuraminate synthase family protein n=1 Tax=Sedimentibacter sp. zth1 TaxID=2816908 RepID=UPI001A938D66|nr:N-acetylneuraminate synthase family protein [Sedimentibacter sp. zth1]QSX07146.1 N-acetylneuraminate synthase family protein [Sedimentibacter sp. zth1]
MKIIKIGEKEISMLNKPYFVADIAANHDGSLQRAFKLIELAKEAGADAAKFQNFKASTIVSRNGFDSMNGQLSHQKNWKKSVYDVYEDASISVDWTPLLKKKCEEVGIEYLTSPYDFHNVDIADKYSNCFKIGSGDITWKEIVEYIAKKGKPVLLATGASSIEDVERAVNTIEMYNENLILMQCNTNYTANDDNYNYINLNVLRTYKEKFPNAILGLSDHTYGYETVLGAIALGARVIEKHFTDDNNRIGPDHKFSMNPTTWCEMVISANKLYNALGDGIKKIESNEKETSVVQRRALYFKYNFSKGHILTKEDIFPLRPIRNGQIPPYDIEKLIGKSLVKDVYADEAITWGDVE